MAEISTFLGPRRVNLEVMFLLLRAVSKEQTFGLMAHVDEMVNLGPPAQTGATVDAMGLAAIVVPTEGGMESLGSRVAAEEMAAP